MLRSHFEIMKALHTSVKTRQCGSLSVTEKQMVLKMRIVTLRLKSGCSLTEKLGLPSELSDSLD